MKQNFHSILADHKEVFEQTFNQAQIDLMEKIAREILKAFKAGNKVLLCGNGGSAADAQHIAAEFIGRFKLERHSLPAIALTTDTSCLTALGNDYGYAHIFERQVEGLGHKGDILIAISTSGNSENVLLAANKAKQQHMLTIGFTGTEGGKLATITDINFKVSSKKTPHIQEMHITALHAISEVVEAVLYGS